MPSSNAVDLGVPGIAELHGRRSQKWTGQDAGVLCSTIAELDFPLAPPVAAAVRAAVDRHDLGYAPEAPDSLREAFAGFARRRLGWAVDTQRITLVPDVMVGIVELCRALVPPGEGIAWETPAYPPFFLELPLLGRPIQEVPMRDDGGIDLDALEAVFAGGVRAFVHVDPHNPTGRVRSRDELARLAELCAAYRVWVLADEIHGPLTLPGATHTPWLAVSDAARDWGVALTSASKAFNVAGLKAALAVTASDRPLAAAGRLPEFPDHSGLLGILAAEAAFGEGDAWLEAVLAQLDANRALLGERLAAELPEVEWRAPQGTYLAWLDCRALGLGEDPSRAFLERGRVALSPGPTYGAPGAGFVRLNFGTSPELVGEMVRRMAAAL